MNNELAKKKSAGDAGTSTDTISNDTNILPQTLEEIKRKFDLIDFGTGLKGLIEFNLKPKPLTTISASDCSEFSDAIVDLIYVFENEEYVAKINFYLSKKSEASNDENILD